MEDWQQEFWQSLDTWANEVNQFWEGVAQDVVETIDAVAKASDAIADEVLRSFETETERIDDWLDVLLEYDHAFNQQVEAVTRPIVQTFDPVLQEHPTCVGCRHYHGQAYGGNLLICGMYPYGPNAESCPDWESAWARGRENAPF